MLILLDNHGCIQRANAAAYHNLDYAAGALDGVPLLTILAIGELAALCVALQPLLSAHGRAAHGQGAARPPLVLADARQPELTYAVEQPRAVAALVQEPWIEFEVVA